MHGRSRMTKDWGCGSIPYLFSSWVVGKMEVLHLLLFCFGGVWGSILLSLFSRWRGGWEGCLFGLRETRQEKVRVPYFIGLGGEEGGEKMNDSLIFSGSEEGGKKVCQLLFLLGSEEGEKKVCEYLICLGSEEGGEKRYECHVFFGSEDGGNERCEYQFFLGSEKGGEEKVWASCTR